jgi:hypothetical protein
LEVIMKKHKPASLALIARLRAAGCPNFSEVPCDSPLGLIIEIARPELSVAYDVRAGVECVIAACITNRSYSRLILRRFRASLPWPSHLLLFSDPRIYMPEKKVYRFESEREFACEQVLNHQLNSQGSIEPGGSVEGVLLGYTMFDQIPFEYSHGEMATVRLSVIDQFEREHCSDIEMFVDRTATMRPIRSARSKYGLFDQPTTDDPSSLAQETEIQPDRNRVSNRASVDLDVESPPRSVNCTISKQISGRAGT